MLFRRTNINNFMNFWNQTLYMSSMSDIYKLDEHECLFQGLGDVGDKITKGIEDLSGQKPVDQVIIVVIYMHRFIRSDELWTVLVKYFILLLLLIISCTFFWVLFNHLVRVSKISINALFHYSGKHVFSLLWIPLSGPQC